MRPASLFLLLTSLAAAGVAAARPDAVAPLAGRFIEPLFAQQAERPAAVAKPGSDSGRPATAQTTALPTFVPSAQGLSFTGSDDDAADAPSGATAALTAAPEATEAAAGAPAAPMAFPSAEPQKPAPTPRAAAVTIEPDPAATSAEASANTPLPDDKKAGKPEPIAAKLMFGATKTPAPLASRAIGSYAKGCLSGGVALPVDGPAWQAMRLARNRNWGHPDLVKLVQRLATDAQKHDGWPGLLVGDLSQPRGGPMLTGHASHQIGLDADVWLTPMPKRKLSMRERNEMAATSMLDDTWVAVNEKVFTDKHVKLIKRAASYPQVERILVHPAIKKALCEASGEDRKWLGKVRPIGGHFYHFHIRIGCPPGFGGCTPQVPTTGEDGCGKEVEQWLARVKPSKAPPKPKPPGYKPPPPKPPITMAQLPPECSMVIKSGPDGINPTKFSAPKQAAPKLSSIYAGAALKPHLKRLSAAASRQAASGD